MKQLRGETDTKREHREGHGASSRQPGRLKVAQCRKDLLQRSTMFFNLPNMMVFGSQIRRYSGDRSTQQAEFSEDYTQQWRSLLRSEKVPSHFAVPETIPGPQLPLDGCFYELVVLFAGVLFITALLLGSVLGPLIFENSRIGIRKVPSKGQRSRNAPWVRASWLSFAALRPSAHSCEE